MKLGIIGLGVRMSTVIQSLKKVDPEAKVVGVVDPDPEKVKARLTEEERAKVRFYPSISELVAGAKPDALAIGTRCDTHAPIAIAAAKYPLPLFLEKPVATSLRQAVALDRAFQKSRSRVLVSFPLRASLLCQRAKALVQRGDIGRVEHILGVNYVHYGQVYFEQWYRDYSVTQGLFLQKATHDLDYLAFLAGAPIVRVAAMVSCGRVYRDKKTRGRKPDPCSEYWEGIGTPEEGMNEDASSALLEFENGAQGVYTQVFYSKRMARRGATLSGFLGALSFDWYTGNLQCAHHREPYTETTAFESQENHFGGDIALARNFIAMVRENAPSLAPIERGLESVYACLAAKESSQTSKFVQVRRVGE